MIESIYIKNFKSILEDEVKLPRLGAIVGVNAAGKTNLIQAISLIKDLVIGDSLEVATRKITLTPQELFNFHNQSSNEMSLRIKVKNGDDTSYSLEIVIALKIDDRGFPKLSITSEQFTRIKDDLQEIIYQRSENNLKRGSGDPIPLAIDADKLAVNLYKESDVESFKAIMSKVAIPETDVMNFRESIVDQGQGGLASLLVRLRHKTEPGNFELFQKVIKKLLVSFSSVVEISAPKTQETTTEVGDENKLYIVLLEEKNLKGTLSMKSVSAGDLKTLYLIANIINMKSGSTFITEEIENGLHPKRLKDVIGHLDEIARQKNIQLLFTTHNPDVINTLRPSEVLSVKKEENQGSHYQILSESRDITQIEKLLKEGGQLASF